MPDHRICNFLGRNRYAAHAFFQIPDFRDVVCIGSSGSQLCDFVLWGSLRNVSMRKPACRGYTRIDAGEYCMEHEKKTTSQ